VRESWVDSIQKGYYFCTLHNVALRHESDRFPDADRILNLSAIATSERIYSQKTTYLTSISACYDMTILQTPHGFVTANEVR